ncbi:MAG: ABC transporter permease [Planctomycetota bacterium]|nr:ABC transporter permease [Planctomycetota bacterium]
MPEAAVTPTSRPSLLRRLVAAPESGLVLVILLVMITLTVFGGTKEKRIRDADTGEWTKLTVNRFLDFENLVLVAKDASFIAIMAVGMTAVIVIGGIDLSVGSMYALAALLGALALRALQGHWLGVPPGGAIVSAGGAPLWAALPIGLGVCCLVGAACGAANGALVVGLRVHPFIITLGTMAALRGVVFVITGGLSISGMPESLSAGFFKSEVAGVYPVPLLVMLATAVAGHLVLTRLVLGRHAFGIGGNETAARYAGIPVGRVKIIVHTLCGLLAGLSACVYVGYYAAFEPNAGNGYELSVIAATVIGGASLSGGRGSALGAVLGAILIQLITNAMIILDIDSSYTSIVMGAAIVIAVVMDQTKARLSSKRA